MLLASAWRDGVFQRRAGAMPCHSASAGAALHIRTGLANAMLLPTVMGFNRGYRCAGALQPASAGR